MYKVEQRGTLHRIVNDSGQIARDYNNMPLDGGGFTSSVQATAAATQYNQKAQMGETVFFMPQHSTVMS